MWNRKEYQSAKRILNELLDMISLEEIASGKVHPSHDGMGDGVGRLEIGDNPLAYSAFEISIFMGADEVPYHWDIYDHGNGPIAVFH